MPHSTIALLYGGKSGEHEVSRRSAASVLRNLDGKRYSVVLIGIDLDGVWYLQEAEAAESRGEGLELTVSEREIVSAVPGKGLYHAGRRLPVDVVFPVLHGTFGEDGTVQGLLELCGLPYVGAGLAASAVSMDKERAKQLWQHAGLRVVPWITLMKHEYRSSSFSLDTLGRNVSRSLGYPVFVKPASSGSSVGVRRVNSAHGLASALDEAFRYDLKVLIERGIDAREIECSVTGQFGSLVAYVPGEIIPSHVYYDYDAKYTDPDGAALRIPAELPEDTLESVKKLAVEAFGALGCEGMARVDFFIDRRSGDIYLNEINTIPGFTSISMFPRMCEAAGLSYTDLLSDLISFAVERAIERNGIRYRK